VAPPGSQPVNGENKHQADVSGETGLLDPPRQKTRRSGDGEISTKQIVYLEFFDPICCYETTSP